MSILATILSRGAADLVKNIGDAFDANFTSKEERLNARNALMVQATDLINMLQTERSKQISAESKGNWLQRSWRPIVMLLFAIVVLYAFFIQPAFFPGAEAVKDSLTPEFWSLLKLGMGGYVIGRSTEKIVQSVSENMNISRKIKRQK